MAYLDQLIQTQEQYLRQQLTNQEFIGLPKGGAYSSYFPTYEVTSPQYVQPNAYTLAQLGYRTNEVAYACIDLWMKTISEAPMKVYDKKTGEEVEGHPFTEFMEHPTPDLSQADFWNAVTMYLKIAGTMAWEKEFNMIGDVINIWPMMPQYCSYMRGERRLLATVRYQPYTGLPYLDIDRSKCVIFSYVDPLYYGLKPFSPTAVLADVIGVDNDMTVMLQSFLRNGAFVSGLLKTEQLIDEDDAKFAREKWQEVHGGKSNAGNVAVLGKGIEFQATGMNFRDMVFPEVDARNEIRICMVYGVKPILLSAKAGMDRSTFSNYEEARKAWYEENVTSEWSFLEDRITRDLLRHFDEDLNHVAMFDRSKIKALQEDRDSAWKRADEAFKARVVTRDEARKEKGLDPMEDKALGEELYMTVMEQSSLSVEDNADIPNDSQSPKGKETAITPKSKSEDEKAEEKAFRRFAAKRLSENKAYMIGEFEFKYIDEQRQRQLLNEFGVLDAEAAAILEALKGLKNDEKENDMKLVINQPASVQMVNEEVMKALQEQFVQAFMVIGNQFTKAFEAKTAEIKNIPAPIVQNVINPTPIEVINNVEVPTVNNEINVDIPKLESSADKIKRDEQGNITGKVTSYKYEKKDE
jgi:HK97 family phage portal protein